MRLGHIVPSKIILFLSADSVPPRLCSLEGYFPETKFSASDAALMMPVAMAGRKYPFPFRTRKSSSPAPMILRERESRWPPAFFCLNHFFYNFFFRNFTKKLKLLLTKNLLLYIVVTHSKRMDGLLAQ